MKFYFALSIKILYTVAVDDHLQCFELKETTTYQLLTFQSLAFFEPRNIVTIKNG